MANRLGGGRGEGPLDAFRYWNDPERPAAVNCSAHCDRGVLGCVALSATPGLEILDREAGAWVAVEELGLVPLEHVVVFVCKALECATEGEYWAAPHRVVRAAAPRLSISWELRLPPPLDFQDGTRLLCRRACELPPSLPSGGSRDGEADMA